MWCDIFSMKFPGRDLTRKIVEISLVFPKFIREKPLGFINKILSLEQEGERLHNQMNNLERKNLMILNRAEQFWKIMEDYENKLYSDDSIFKLEKDLYTGNSVGKA